eukprot:TRINITY_DN1066_c0_g1_i1.p1 TRINITY_DN1066_c0_g1~~TRINITY_DN1066_c0_g1_i1.p1  ORF type:complete len:227 (+),score=39.71 TRINITY_DN1066_c0_g1_i1:36-716(+)
MKVKDQLDLFIFIYTTLTLYVVLEYDDLVNPQFLLEDYWLLTKNDTYLEDTIEIQKFKIMSCGSTSVLWPVFIGGCAIVMVCITSYCYVIKGIISDDSICDNLSWKKYSLIFLMPFALVLIGLGTLFGSRIIWQYCYTSRNFVISVSFVLLMIIGLFSNKISKRLRKAQLLDDLISPRMRSSTFSKKKKSQNYPKDDNDGDKQQQQQQQQQSNSVVPTIHIAQSNE